MQQDYKMILRLLWELNIVDIPNYLKMYSNKLLGSRFVAMHGKKIQTIPIGKAADLMGDLARYISKGEIPNDRARFLGTWLSIIGDLIENEVFSISEGLELANSINPSATGTWTQTENTIIESILDVYRLSIATKQPDIMEYIENPSFTLLMELNGLETVTK